MSNQLCRILCAALILTVPLDPSTAPTPGPLTQGPGFPYPIPDTAGPPNCYPGQQPPC
jgi:hypothetical protein